jgi:hypothetical protein
LFKETILPLSDDAERGAEVDPEVVVEQGPPGIDSTKLHFDRKLNFGRISTEKQHL